jgi:hypothetical protein
MKGLLDRSMSKRSKVAEISPVVSGTETNPGYAVVANVKKEFVSWACDVLECLTQSELLCGDILDLCDSLLSRAEGLEMFGSFVGNIELFKENLILIKSGYESCEESKKPDQRKKIAAYLSHIMSAIMKRA